MTNTETRFIQDAFDEAAAGYDRPAMRFFDNSAKELAQSLPLQGDERVLDAATGTGKIALALAPRLKQGHVTGVDLSTGMLSAAQKKAAGLGLTNVSFIEKDVNAVDFPKASLDGLTCGFGVHFWPQMEKSLTHLLSFIKKDGFVATTSFAKGSFEPHASLCLKRFADYGVKLPTAYSLERLDHPEKNRQLLEQVGLRNIQITEHQAGYYLGRAADWWDLVLYTGYRAFLNQLSATKADRFKQEFLADVEATKTAEGVFLNVMVIRATANK